MLCESSVLSHQETLRRCVAAIESIPEAKFPSIQLGQALVANHQILIYLLNYLLLVIQNISQHIIIYFIMLYCSPHLLLLQCLLFIIIHCLTLHIVCLPVCLPYYILYVCCCFFFYVVSQFILSYCTMSYITLCCMMLYYVSLYHIALSHVICFYYMLSYSHMILY